MEGFVVSLYIAPSAHTHISMNHFRF